MSFAIVGTTLAVGGAVGGIAQASKKSKFRTPTIPSLSQLTDQAVSAQRQQLKGGIGNINEFGSSFLSSQIEAQRGAVPGFFDQTRAAIGQGEDLISRLIGGDLEQRLTTQKVRGAQAARGLSLSPASAIQEGLAVQRQQAQNEFQAFGLRGQLAGLESATPFGVQTFDPGISGLGQLTGFGLNRAGAQSGFQAQQQQVKIQQQDAARAAQAGGLARLSGGFGGLAGGGGLQGFLGGSGLGPTQQRQQFPSGGFGQSNVTSTAGPLGSFG